MQGSVVVLLWHDRKRILVWRRNMIIKCVSHNGEHIRSHNDHTLHWVVPISYEEKFGPHNSGYITPVLTENE